jgi:hypothetical protein
MSGVLQRKGKWFEQEAVAARDSQTPTADRHCRFCGLPSLCGVEFTVDIVSWRELTSISITMVATLRMTFVV